MNSVDRYYSSVVGTTVDRNRFAVVLNYMGNGVCEKEAIEEKMS
jgi:hypothetical protein